MMTMVVGSHLRWDGVRQRPQHLLSRLAKHAKIIVVEEPFAADYEADEVREVDGLSVVRPLRRSAGYDVDARAFETIHRLAGSDIDVVWLYTPMMIDIVDAFTPRTVVFDCMDDLRSFANAPAELGEREARLMSRADVVFCGGRSLHDARKAAHPNVHLYASGVETARFRRARMLEPHPLLRDLARPILTYTGVIDERIDVDTIAYVADALPEMNVMMVGPVVKIDPATLPRRTNVHFTGIVAYDTLPSFLAGTDVALMPFALNESTHNISPTKTLEYFAAGVPVATTPIADVATAFADLAYIAPPGAPFVDAIRAALVADPDRLARAQAVAAEHDWDSIADAMWRDLQAARAMTSAPSRASAH